MDLSKYLDLFVSESRNHIDAIDELIVSLEQNSNDAHNINELFRHMHSLKGMASTMQFDPITKLSHAMEDLLSKVRSNQLSFNAEMADILLSGKDLISTMVDALESGDQAWQQDISAIIGRLAVLISAPPITPDTVLSAEEPPPPAKQAESPELASAQPLRQTDTLKSVRIKTDTLDRLVNITGELFTTRHQLAELSKTAATPGLNVQMKQLSTLLRELREVVLQARMLPFSHISERFPRLVRDLARAQNKDIAFEVAGKEIELDRGVLEEITEPLAHILRNAVDHGMESVEERRQRSKPEQGRITVSLLRDKDHVTIAIADDGRGMDPQYLAEQAVQKGIISRKTATGLTPQEALQLVCAPGFSTAAVISNVSGRGVGMDAVKTAIQNLGGSLIIDSRKGLGSIFLMKLPISVSIIHALLVENNGLTVALPVNTVDRTLELQQTDILDHEGQQVFNLAGQFIPLFNLPRSKTSFQNSELGIYIPVVLSGLDSQPFGVAVDQIIGQQEIFVKPLGKPLNLLHNCTGGSIAGDGSIIFVMDVSALK